MGEFYYKEGSPASCNPRRNGDEPGFLDVLDEHGARYVSGLRRPPSKSPVRSGTFRFEVYIETEEWMSALTLRGWFAVAGFPEVTIRRASADERTRLKCISKDGLAPGAELDCNDATLLDPASKRLLHKTNLFDNPSDRWAVTVNGSAYVPPLTVDGRKQYGRSVEDLLGSRLASLDGCEYSMARVTLPDGRSVVRANVWTGRLVHASVLLAALTGKVGDDAGFNHSSIEIERVSRLDVMPDLDSDGTIKDYRLITEYPDADSLRPPTTPAAPMPEGGVDPGVSDTIVESDGSSSGLIRPFGTLEYLHWQDVANEYDRFEATTSIPLLCWRDNPLPHSANQPEWRRNDGLVWDDEIAAWRPEGSSPVSYGELRAKWPTDESGAGAWDGDEEKWIDPEDAARLVQEQYDQAFARLLKDLIRLADEWCRYLHGKYKHLYVQDEDADQWSWHGKYPCDDATEHYCITSLRSGIIPILWDRLRRESPMPGDGFDFPDPRSMRNGKKPWVTMLDRDQPTTAWCPKCGRRTKHDTSERTFHCQWCGYEAQRDKHAARNMIILGKNPIPRTALKHGYGRPMGNYQYKPEDQQGRATGPSLSDLGSLVALHIGNGDDDGNGDDEDWDF
ncbi:zinc ribbon domain-containing protein [Bifidobacterium olomucense]|nr:zinc ribbon domain-containing protein [Bifidobacterium sp. DSM 109959]